MKVWHPWQLKKSKSWGSFLSYQLNSTANSVHFAQFLGKQALQIKASSFKSCFQTLEHLTVGQNNFDNKKPKLTRFVQLVVIGQKIHKKLNPQFLNRFYDLVNTIYKFLYLTLPAAINFSASYTAYPQRRHPVEDVFLGAPFLGAGMKSTLLKRKM